MMNIKNTYTPDYRGNKNEDTEYYNSKDDQHGKRCVSFGTCACVCQGQDIRQMVIAGVDPMIDRYFLTESDFSVLFIRMNLLCHRGHAG